MDFQRLFEIPEYQLKHYPLRHALGGKSQGKTTVYSSQELVDTINRLSLGMLEMGLRRDDKIALISYNNRPEWNIVDFAAQQIGVITVPVYPTISSADYVYIFQEAEVKYCFLGFGDLYDKVQKAAASLPALQEIFCFDEHPSAPSWTTVFSPNTDYTAVEEIKATIKAHDLATIIYTSGTTGNPKGVMLSHDNIASNVKSVGAFLPVKPGDRALSFLPLCHIFERTVSCYYIARGVSVQYAESMETIAANLKEWKPNFFSTVPRLLEKVYERIFNTGLALTGIKKRLFFWALDLTKVYEYDFKPSGVAALKWKIADKLIFSKWREALGGEVRGIVTGAAACPRRMAQVFSAAGIPIREGYGLTETSPVITFGRFDQGEESLLGTVGPVISGVEIKIDSSEGIYREGEGEILCKGPNVMMGYYKQPEITAQVLDADGWFRTGDVGTLIMSKIGTPLLKITDRKKELLKTSGGKYVAPTPIESKFKEDFLVEQMMVIGEGKKFVSALIVPAFPALEEWCKEQNISWNERSELLYNEKVMARYEEVIQAYNPNFSHIEQIKKFVLLPDEWTVATGELTPSLKLKRRVIMEKYQPIISKIYDEH